jgi:single-stranded DNA-binding protein
VKIVGRVGAAPHYTEGKRALIVNFPLAEHIEGQEQPVWHRVYTTGDRARRLQENPIDTGQQIRVSGYRQQRERKGRDGQTELVEVVYAAHIHRMD